LTAPWESAIGLLLVYFLPGFGITRAVFPERRVFRPWSAKDLLEQATASIVLSVGTTILVGYAWLGTSLGVQAGWNDPVIEVTLAVVAAVAFAVAAGRGSFSREPPPGPLRADVATESDPMELVHELERLSREERGLRHRIRVAGPGSKEAEPLAQELSRVRAEAARLRAERGEAYDRD
jgi:hypothetical protein